MHSRREILNKHFREYQRATKKGRTEILDRLVPVTGMNRSYLVTALRNPGKKGQDGAKDRRRPRPEGKRGGSPITG